MDIAQFNNKRFSEARSFHPVSPAPDSQELDGVTLTVTSTEVGEAYAISKRLTTEHAAYATTLQRSGAVNTSFFDRREKLEIEMACAVLTGFEGLLENGKSIEYNEENKRRLMTEHKWLRAQVIQKADDESFFYKKDQSNS